MRQHNDFRAAYRQSVIYIDRRLLWEVKAKFLGMDNCGKERVSSQVVDQETGEDLSMKQGETPAEGEGEKSED